MAKLTTEARDNLSDSDFALPGERRYPIHNRSHAKNALARVSQFGSEREKVLVKAAVHRKYPNMHSFSYKHDPKDNVESEND